MRFLLVLTLFIVSSCASYVQSVHRQIDNENRVRKNRYYQQRGDRKPIQNPVTLGGPSANNNKNLPPRVRRNYAQGKQRFKASDLKDNQSDGSLWSGKNSENFLFVTNNLKRVGDIVIIEVKKNLKDKIQEELKRAFPDPPKRRGSKKKAAEKPAEEKNVAENAAPEAKEDPNKTYDKISTSVVEVVNQDYLLLRGRKEVMFKKYKRYFEIQALASQKDITSKDTISSDSILEPKINILRY